jgi:hypothetical protein
MKRLVISLAIAGLAAVGSVAAVSAADPTATPTPAATPAPITAPVVRGPDTGTLSGILGMSQAEIQALRTGGKTLAQIAEDKGIDPQRLVDALAAAWGARIDERVAVGALTADQATALKADLAVRAKAMVNQATMGGMRGAAVGAGPGSMGGGQGMGGRGMGRSGAQGGAQGGGMGRWGTGAGTGTCPMTTAPTSQS